jgi:hypothetical protein
MDTIAASRERYQKFLQRVVAEQEVWLLRPPTGGVAITGSNDDPSRDVMLFWSARAYAQRCAVDEWAAHAPDSIPLDAFLERWLTGLHADNMLAGCDWTGQLVGLELAPETVKTDLLAALTGDGSTNA